ncbi:Bug family tripartite tricarboxylate transporter substrate binding protein [Parapusillimonas sp. JC17]|uniref:Bug family tripartite tricarboxylate transporter substrate binding protein n=1 Tax=Parapusillimonas sp. JC17 TaxID=3445768 RepID=UPI003F9F5E8D
MKILRTISTALSMCLFACTAAVAADFPTRPVKVVIPYSAGGTSDILGRLVQGPLSENLGQSVIIENKPGGASVIGTSQVARATPDGHTILFADLALLVNPGLMADLPYDTTKDFRAITGFAKAPLVLLINGDLPFNSLPELIDYAKKNPGKLNFGSGGYGSSTHIAGELFKKVTGLDIMHVPFQGVAPAMTAILSGQVEIYFGGTTTALQHLREKRLKALAITGNQRNTLIPDVPTFKEQSVDGMNADTYWGVYAPAGTPDAAIVRLNQAFEAAMKDPKVKERVDQFGIELIHNSPEEQDKAFRQMVDYWSRFIKETGIKVQ